MEGCTRVVSGQRLGKNVLAVTETNATTEELCFLCGPCRDVISKIQSQSLVSSLRQFVKTGLDPEAEESPLLEPLPRSVY
jgi:hypothetical protein